MLITHQPQVTNPNQSGRITSVELSPELVAALTAAGVDLDQVETHPDDTVTITTDGDVITIGEEEGWITANLESEGSEIQLYEGRSITELAAAVARPARLG